MIITLRQMQYAIAVADSGSFSKAADICAADQSTVSQQVKILEERLGIVIFNRNSIPIKVTPEGLQVIIQAREIISKVEELIRPFKTPRI